MARLQFLWLIFALIVGVRCFAIETANGAVISTFSIVARDPLTGDIGVAVQSRYFAVGEVVPHAAANVGAVATQALGNLLYGPEGLELLRNGKNAEQVVASLIADDPLREERQVGVIDGEGRAASYTGSDCLPWAGGRVGKNYAVQGNLLAGPQVVDAMATAFETRSGDLATRMVYALAAGQAAGGDARGRQSAALLIVREKGGYMGLTDRYIDLQVEDHPTPIRELMRLLKIRLAQLENADANKLLKKAESTSGKERGNLLEQARMKILRALELYPEDDYGWWALAHIRLLQGDSLGAAQAGQRALFENPAWRHLPPSTRAALGVDQTTISALLEVDLFRRVWDSLAPEEAEVQ